MSTLDVENFHGIFHPTGTTRIGDDQDNAVVDCNLKVFGLDNLYTVSTAVLPNSGAVNPTLEALRLGARLAKKLGDKIHLNE
jgi:choline dehydrogenase-like flavoprotein